MRVRGLVIRRKCRFRPTPTESNHQQPVAENLLNRSFGITFPIRLWWLTSPISRSERGYFTLRLIDLFSRRVVGWAMLDCIDRQVALDALEMTIVYDGKAVKGVLHHSDRSSH